VLRKDISGNAPHSHGSRGEHASDRNSLADHIQIDKEVDQYRKVAVVGGQSFHNCS